MKKEKGEKERKEEEKRGKKKTEREKREKRREVENYRRLGKMMIIKGINIKIDRGIIFKKKRGKNDVKTGKNDVKTGKING